MRSIYRRGLLALALCTVMIVPAAVSANEEKDLMDLASFSDVLVHALDVSEAVYRSDLGKVQAEAAFDETQALLRPQLQLSGEHNRQSAALIPFSGLQGWQSDDTVWNTEASLTLVQQLGANPQLRGGLDQAQLGIDLSDLQHQQTVIETMLTVQESYNSWIESYQAVQVADLALELAEAELEIQRDKLARGAATELDLLQQQNEVFQSEMQWQRAQSGFNMASARLLQLLDMYPADDGELRAWGAMHSQGLPDSVEPWEADLDAAWQLSQQQRPEARMLALQVKQAQIQYDVAKGERNWTVTASGTYMWDQTALIASVDSDRTLTGTIAQSWEKEADGLLPDMDIMPAQGRIGPLEDEADERPPDDGLVDVISGLLGSDDDTNPWQVSLGANYRFGDGGAGRAEERRLAAAVAAAESEKRSAMDMLFLDVYAAFEEMDHAYRSWNLAQSHRREAEETSARLQESVERGIASQRDLHQASVLVAQAEQEVIRSILAYRANQAQFGAVMGLDMESMRRGMAAGQWPSLTADGR